jgi:protocatechuate 3,4-dioxygenase beta subunit
MPIQMGHTMSTVINIVSGHDSTYKFATFQPGDYQIAENPPDYRCSHIHVRITAPGFKTLTTQLYFPNDKYNATDHWFNKKMVVTPPAAYFDFVLEKDR